MKKIVGVIPARYDSTRFPGKPLVDINGKSMIQRVFEQASKVKALTDVVVATDDKRIFDHVNTFGQAIMTASNHESGTDRCAEISSSEYDIVINIQGDEPFIYPEQIEELIACFDEGTTQIATLVKQFEVEDELFDSNRVKVVLNKNSEAIYFSRNPIPFLRGVDKGNWLAHQPYYKHVGIYGYKTDILKEITKLPVSLLEKSEGLEQLRWIENGFKIKVNTTTYESPCIDTPEDLEKLLTELS